MTGTTTTQKRYASTRCTIGKKGSFLLGLKDYSIWNIVIAIIFKIFRIRFELLFVWVNFELKILSDISLICLCIQMVFLVSSVRCLYEITFFSNRKNTQTFWFRALHRNFYIVSCISDTRLHLALISQLHLDIQNSLNLFKNHRDCLCQE